MCLAPRLPIVSRLQHRVLFPDMKIKVDVFKSSFMACKANPSFILGQKVFIFRTIIAYDV